MRRPAWVTVMVIAALALVAGTLWLTRDRSSSETGTARSQAESGEGPRLQGARVRPANRPAPTEVEPAPREEQEELAGPGRPGALRVLLHTKSDDSLEGVVVQVEGEGLESREIRVGADGVALFEGLTAPEVRWRVRADAFVGQDGWRTLRLLAGSVRETDVWLEPGGSIYGQVLDARTRRPIQGALVLTRGGGVLPGRQSSGGEYCYATSTTDAEGRYRLTRQPLDSILTVVAQLEGYTEGGEPVELHRGTREARQDLLLERGGWVDVTVLDVDANPAAGAWVALFDERVRPSEGRPVLWQSDVERFHGASDEQGHVRLVGLPFGTPYVAIATPAPSARARATSLTSTTIEVSERDSGAAVSLRLRQEGSLHVQFLDESGVPVPEPSLVLPGSPLVFTKELRAGRASLQAHLPPGRWNLHASAQGFAPSDTEVDLPEGEALEFTVRLRHGAALSGVVRDKRGEPVRRATVWACPVATDVASDIRSSETDAEGRFSLDDLGPRSCWIVVRNDAVRSAAGPFEPPRSGILINLPEVVRVQLRLLPPSDSEGSLWADIGLRRRGRSIEMIKPYVRRELAPPGRNVLYMEWEQPPEPIDVYVLSRRFAPMVIGTVGNPGDVLDLGERRVDLGHTMLVHARTPDGRAPPGVAAACMMADWWRFEQRSEGDGFRFDQLPVGVPLRFEVGAPDWVAVRREVTLGAGSPPTIDLVLTRGAVLVGTLRNARGGLTLGQEVAIDAVEPDGRTTLAKEALRTDDRARFFARLAPGRYVVRLWADPDPAHPEGVQPPLGEPFTLAEGEERRMDFTVR